MTEQQRRATQLAATGWGNTAIAKQLGISAKTVQRWRKLPDFAEAMARSVEPSLRAVLEDAAFTATKRDGSPDHSIRIAAARTLMMLSDGTPKDAPPTVITIFQERAA
jgi:hypothetical protein